MGNHQVQLRAPIRQLMKRVILSRKNNVYRTLLRFSEYLCSYALLLQDIPILFLFHVFQWTIVFRMSLMFLIFNSQKKVQVMLILRFIIPPKLNPFQNYTLHNHTNNNNKNHKKKASSQPATNTYTAFTSII